MRGGLLLLSVQRDKPVGVGDVQGAGRAVPEGVEAEEAPPADEEGIVDSRGK